MSARPPIHDYELVSPKTKSTVCWICTILTVMLSLMLIPDTPVVVWLCVVLLVAVSTATTWKLRKMTKAAEDEEDNISISTITNGGEMNQRYIDRTAYNYNMMPISLPPERRDSPPNYEAATLSDLPPPTYATVLLTCKPPIMFPRDRHDPSPTCD